MIFNPQTSFSVKDGKFRQYRGSRDKDEFMSFVEERRWQEVEEVPAWKSPASFQMSVVSQFFKVGGHECLRNLNVGLGYSVRGMELEFGIIIGVAIAGDGMRRGGGFCRKYEESEGEGNT